MNLHTDGNGFVRLPPWMIGLFVTLMLAAMPVVVTLAMTYEIVLDLKARQEKLEQRLDQVQERIEELHGRR